MTFFTIPKSFCGRTDIIQSNAIQSWKHLHRDCEIILCGDDPGTAAAARKLSAMHIPRVSRNRYGTPLISSAFRLADKEASHRLLCYVNADIILFPNFLAAIQSIPFHRFLMIGQRWDLDVHRSIRFECAEWENVIRKQISERGVLHPPTGIDYFVFPKGLFLSLPPFAVGRPGWDNWMVYWARAKGIPVVDATRVATVVHQNHDYAHVRYATDSTTEGPEAVRNRELTGGWANMFNIKDATHLLTPANSACQASITLRRNWATLPVSIVRARKKISYLSGAGFRAVKRRLASKQRGM